MNMDTTSGADSAREKARRSNGEFGEQVHSEPYVNLGSTKRNRFAHVTDIAVLRGIYEGLTSPENLDWDGERPQEEVQRHLAVIDADYRMRMAELAGEAAGRKDAEAAAKRRRAAQRSARKDYAAAQAEAAEQAAENAAKAHLANLCSDIMDKFPEAATMSIRKNSNYDGNTWLAVESICNDDGFLLGQDGAWEDAEKWIRDHLSVDESLERFDDEPIDIRKMADWEPEKP